MKIIEQLTNSSLQKQKKWIDKNHPNHMQDAHNDTEFGYLLIGLEDTLEEYMNFDWTDDLGELISSICDDITPTRQKEINDKSALTAEEKASLQAMIIEDEFAS